MFVSALSKIKVENTWKGQKRNISNKLDVQGTALTENIEHEAEKHPPEKLRSTKKDEYRKHQANDTTYSFQKSVKRNETHVNEKKQMHPSMYVNNGQCHIFEASRTLVFSFNSSSTSYDEAFFCDFGEKYGHVAYVFTKTNDCFAEEVKISWFDVQCTFLASREIGYDLYKIYGIELLDIKIEKSNQVHKKIDESEKRLGLSYHMVKYPSLYIIVIFTEDPVKIIKCNSLLSSFLRSLGPLRKFEPNRSSETVSIYEFEYFDVRDNIRAIYELEKSGIPEMENVVFESTHLEEIAVSVYENKEIAKIRGMIDLLKKGIINLSKEKSFVTTFGSVKRFNKLDLARIYKGKESRTTIMIRNIPYSFTQARLKQWLDETNENTYEFLHLRVNHINKSFGYAFVAFASPNDVMTLVLSRAARQWQNTLSMKYCDICYANLQGVEQLVAQFSKIEGLDMPLESQPKLYYIEGDNIGKEKPFPMKNSSQKSFTVHKKKGSLRKATFQRSK